MTKSVENKHCDVFDRDVVAAINVRTLMLADNGKLKRRAVNGDTRRGNEALVTFDAVRSDLRCRFTAKSTSGRIRLLFATHGAIEQGQRFDVNTDV